MQLQEALDAWRDFSARGGSRSSQTGRLLRQKISELVQIVKDAEFQEERVTPDDEANAEVDVFAIG